MMTGLIYEALPTERVRALRRGGPDAYERPPELAISDGQGNPCRHCLDQVPEGQGMLILAYRPFGALQPYSETGPIFLCAGDCVRHGGRGRPTVLDTSPDYLLKAYGADERILYGTGRVTPAAEIEVYAAELLAQPGVAFVDVRSARNNCFLLRLRRDT